MRRIFIVLLILTFPFSGFSQPAGIPVWPNGAPNSNGITTPEVKMEGGRVADVSEAQMFVYLPKSVKPTPAVIICPGGGYGRLAMQQEGHEFARWLNEQGIAAIVLKYRMPNGHHDVPLSDVQQTLRTVRWLSPTWNIDSKKIGVVGFSAGGHLASTAATHFVDNATRPDFAVLFYPVVSMDKNITHSGSRQGLLGKKPSPEMVNQYSNELRVTPQTPPTLIFHSDDDEVVSVRNSTDFYAALKQNNIPSSMHIFPTGGHGWGMRKDFAYDKEWKELFVKWLKINSSTGENTVASRNIEALNTFVKENQYFFSLGFIFNEYANEDLIISYMPHNHQTSTLRGFAIIRNGVVYNTSFNIPKVGGNGKEVQCIWNGDYVTVAITGSYNDESTGLYGFQINNENLSQPAVKLWQNTDYELRWLRIYPFSEKVNGNYYFAGERNYTYCSSYRCNMATGEVLFTDDVQVFRAFLPVVYANGNYYGACLAGGTGKICVARATQYYNNTNSNTQCLNSPDMTAWTPVRAFDFEKKRSVMTVKVDQLYYPVFLNNAMVDMSVPGIVNTNVCKYKGKCYLMSDDSMQLIETNDVSYLFDDKYVTPPN
jgi:acetyl esterase/lipase